MGSPGSLAGEELACSVRDPGLIPGSEDPLEKGILPTPGFLPGEFHSPGAWWATVSGVRKSCTGLSD